MKIRDILLRICIFLLIISLVPVVGVNAAPEAPEGAGSKRLEGGQRDLGWPAPGNYNLSSCFLDKREHYSLDVDGETGDRIEASYDGVVVAAFNGCSHNYGKAEDCCGNGWGNYVLLKHEYQLKSGETVDLYSRYAHLTEAMVSEGQQVQKGQQIGTMGSTGYSSGSHLDYEVLYGGYSPVKTYSVDPFVNELLELEDALHTTFGTCCQDYVAYVKELYALCAHEQYDEHGKCINCDAEFDWQATRKTELMGHYAVVTETEAMTSPYAEDGGLLLTEGEQVKVTATVVNVWDETWYEISMGENTQYYVPESALQLTYYFESEIDCNLTTLYPGQTLTQSMYPLGGTITSLYPLKKIIGKLDGVEYASWEAVGTVTQVELRNTALNTKLTFRDLAIGEHTLTILAMDSTGTEAMEILSLPFLIREQEGSVEPEPTPDPEPMPDPEPEPEPEPEPVEITITLNIQPEPRTFTMILGESLGDYWDELPGITEEGMYFVGWFAQPDGLDEVNEDTVPLGDMTLYPYLVSEEFVYTITFDTVAVTAIHGTNLRVLPVATKEGYQFAGWFVVDSDVQVTEEFVFTEALTLESRWEAAQYTVTLNANGGQASKTELTVTYGSAYGALPRPVREGYIFMGWQLENKTITENLQVKVAKDHTLVAIWKEETPTYMWALPVGVLGLALAFVVFHFARRWYQERHKYDD